MFALSEFIEANRNNIQQQSRLSGYVLTVKIIKYRHFDQSVCAYPVV